MKIRWSQHALDRAAEMGLEPAEVEAELCRFTHSYPNPPQYPAGRVFVTDRLAVPIAEDGTIMTILWAGRTGRAD